MTPSIFVRRRTLSSARRIISFTGNRPLTPSGGRCPILALEKVAILGINREYFVMGSNQIMESIGFKARESS